MARRRMRSVHGRNRKRSKVRTRTYSITCASCGTTIESPIPAPEGVELNCVDCETANRDG